MGHQMETEMQMEGKDHKKYYAEHCREGRGKEGRKGNGQKQRTMESAVGRG